MFLARHESNGGPGTTLRNKASRRFTPFGETELEALFREHPDQADTSEVGKYIFLPPVPKPLLLPVLSMYYQLPDDRLRLQLALFVDDEGRREDRAFGYRYESPEGPGQHDFWHAQPILEVRRRNAPAIPLPGLTDHWRPPSTPALPIDARCAIDLLVCLMVSIYGIQKAATMQANGFENKLSGQIRKLCPPEP